ncbi:unnamed protein product [Acanthoscelides obtectus]|nr:unnamed protein product [Acanthoscelides obtectus]CAK1657440.1 Dynein regulatory complex protein 1 homolog [Acanthoscelides obtectus]
MLRNELKESERKFTKDQEKQINDINILTQRIEKQITFMRKAYQKEYELIEEVLMMERKNVIESNDDKWDDLNKRREQQESLNSEKKFQRLEEFNEKMTQTRIDNQEKFRKTKIELEKDIEFLQRELQRIKTLALFNSEKLDYNYQILKKRDDENLIIKSQNKRRMNKLQDVINSIKDKITDYETSTNNQIKNLTEGIKRLHRSIMDIDAKANRFATISEEKFHKVWKVNKSIVEKILKRIIETDRVLHEQQMGIEWEPPSKIVLPKTQLLSYQNALAILHPSITSTLSYRRRVSSVGMVSKQSEVSSKNLLPRAGRKPAADLPPPEECDANSTYKRLAKMILKQLSDKSGFLSEQQLRRLLKGYQDDQNTLVTLDNIFESLKVKDKKDIDLLIDYFVSYAHCPVCAGHEGNEGMSLSRFNSQVSRLSTILTGGDQEEAIDIQELDKAYYAIQQPEEIIDEVVMELVTSETFLEERGLPERDALDEICGEAMLDQYYMDANEIRGVTKKKIFLADERFLCQFSHPLVISSIYIIIALKEFVAGYFKPGKGLSTTKERLERKRNTISRLLDNQDIVYFWEQYKEVFNADRQRVWDALLEGMTSYHEILKKRKLLCDEVVSLRKQNDDLKRLLANYIDHKRFMPPPCSDQANCLKTSAPPYTSSK